jgi:hypothetical protein
MYRLHLKKHGPIEIKFFMKQLLEWLSFKYPRQQHEIAEEEGLAVDKGVGSLEMGRR